MRRKLVAGDIVRHFKGAYYVIIGIGKDTLDCKDVVIYQNIKSEELWVRELEEFMSPVDRNKYPNIKQEYRFELV